MLYNLFVKYLKLKTAVMKHPVKHVHKTFNDVFLIKGIIKQSNIPKNLKQYYADKLLLMVVASA